ncbi:MAG TPA: sugar ABC transporter ATP-binding protein [Acidimicrobiia bacterium]|nr:sugar ABC transporter ATP-binding protein [Acidimicrobiia bacterium]
MTGISKSFGGVRALSGADLVVLAGEIHALVGENGAGKSTILKILLGIHEPDAGEVEIFGERLEHFTPREANSRGVAMIFQELSLIPTMSVAQNVHLTREPRSFGIIDDEEIERRTEELCRDLGIAISPRELVGRLSTGQRQLIEIAKALSQNARILILDEPTSALTTTETEVLFGLLMRLAESGVAIVYVSHRLDEIREIADIVTVLRDGVNVYSGPMSEIGPEGLVRAIVGRNVSAFERVKRDYEIDEPLLEVRNLAGDRLPVDVSFVLHKGEILGIGGLMGSGRTELARILSGVEPKVGGSIRLRGEDLDLTHPADAISAGIVLVPEDRVAQGLVLEHSIASNVSLPILHELAPNGFVDDGTLLSRVDDLVDRLRIKAPSSFELVRRLSGGNQQKVVLGKWLAVEPEVFVLDEPTAGVDIGSKAEIIALIRDLADAGKAIMVISSELPELLAVSDRILVLSAGEIARVITAGEIESWITAHDNVEVARTYAEEQLTLAIQGVSSI